MVGEQLVLILGPRRVGKLEYFVYQQAWHGAITLTVMTTYSV